MHTRGTRQQWLDARLDLLKAEKDLTRRSDDWYRRFADGLHYARKRRDSIHRRINRARGFHNRILSDFLHSSAVHTDDADILHIAVVDI